MSREGREGGQGESPFRPSFPSRASRDIHFFAFKLSHYRMFGFRRMIENVIAAAMALAAHRRLGIVPRMSAQIFSHPHRVTYAECTVGNHIYYGRYLNLLEEARGEFFRTLGVSFMDLQNAGAVFPVLECSLKYKGPARYDDLLTINLSVIQLRGVRLGFGYSITNQTGQLILEGETRHACTTLEDKPQRLPAQLVERLTPFFAPPPVET